VIALACATLLGSAAGRAAGVETGDTCVATGNGTAYTLSITIPVTAPRHFGFVFGVPGASVTNAVVSGTQGAFSTRSFRQAHRAPGSRRRPCSRDRRLRASRRRASGLKSAGKVTPSLGPTARGVKTLAGTGSLHVRLEVVFDPKGGKSASKVVALTLKK